MWSHWPLKGGRDTPLPAHTPPPVSLLLSVSPPYNTTFTNTSRAQQACGCVGVCVLKTTCECVCVCVCGRLWFDMVTLLVGGGAGCCLRVGLRLFPLRGAISPASLSARGS